MGFFDKTDVKFVQLVSVIDERYRLYEKLISEGSEPHPPGLLTLLQEFKNLKVRAWDIESNGNASALVKKIHEDELKEQLQEGDLP